MQEPPNKSTPHNSQFSESESELKQVVEPQKSSHPFRRLLVFQVKLALDAMRDILLSPVSLICTVVDVVEKNQAADSYFEKLMAFGRNTEKRINLFEQHGNENATVDSVVAQVEDVLISEYKNKNISKKTFAAIQKAINKDK